MGSFGVVDGVDGITGSCDRPHLDGNSDVTVPEDEVDLAIGPFYVGGLEPQTLFGEPPGCDPLARRTYRGAAAGQSLSSVFSSFSTLTSRKVSTCTFSKNRAGRNMSQTQASLMVTSK